MKKNYLVILAAAIIAAIGLWARMNTAKTVAAPSSVEWEYGVFRVGGLHRYEWQDADKRIYANTCKVFLERMRLIPIVVKIQRFTDDAPRTSLDYTLDAEFLNYLATQGWELVDVEDLVFWFKRRS